jgi:hypothetical protein
VTQEVWRTLLICNGIITCIFCKWLELVYFEETAKWYEIVFTALFWPLTVFVIVIVELFAED